MKKSSAKPVALPPEGKLYYSISEVCALTGLEAHVLRYWEEEIPQLRPKKNRVGNRTYRPKDIQVVRFLKFLLHEEGYTLAGAKKKMAQARLADFEGQTDLLQKEEVRSGLPAEKGPALRTPEEDGEEGAADAASAALAEPRNADGLQVERLRSCLLQVKGDLEGLLRHLDSRTADGDSRAAGPA